MSAPSPSLASMLVENAQYMPVSSASTAVNNNPEELSACQRECQAQQERLVHCIDAIRAAREEIATDAEKSSNYSSASSDDKLTQVMTCLAPSVQAWTECCSKANTRGTRGYVMKRQRHDEKKT